MNAIEHHRLWTGADPTPDQIRLYREKKHGFFADTWDRDKLLATILLAMYLTYDQENGVFRQVMFAYPKSAEGPITQAIQTMLDKVKVRLSQTSNASIKKQFREHILRVMPNISLGSRVYAMKGAPPYWVAYGFIPGTTMPQWLQEGLL